MNETNKQLLTPTAISGYNYIYKDVVDGITYYYWLESIDYNNNHHLYGPASAVCNSMGVTADIISQNFPNPWSRCAVINFGIPVTTRVRLRIYDVNGKQICTLIDKIYNKGAYSYLWYGTDANGTLLPSGTYFYLLQIGNRTYTKRMVKY